MAESTIITGQFVRISQTPASIGERLIALIIDYFLIGLISILQLPLLQSYTCHRDSTCSFFCLSFICPYSATPFSAKCSITDRVSEKD